MIIPNQIRPSFLISCLTLLLIVIGLWATLGHYFAPIPTADMLQQFNIPPGPQWFLEQLPRYSEHRLMTFLHIVPAMLFLLIIPLQLASKIRSRHLWLHRWSGRVFVMLSISIGGSAIALGFTLPFAGFDETVAALVISTLFMFCLFMGVHHIRRKNIVAHQAWMIRTVAIGLVPTTMRIYFIGILMTTATPASDIFATTMWLGLLTNLCIAHWWLSRANARAIDTNKVANPFARFI